MFERLIAHLLSAADMVLPEFLTNGKKEVFIHQNQFKAPERNHKIVVKPSDNEKRKKKRKAQRIARRTNR